MSLWFCSNMYDKTSFYLCSEGFCYKPYRGQMGTWRWPSGSECPGAMGRATSRQILVSFEGTLCSQGEFCETIRIRSPWGLFAPEWLYNYRCFGPLSGGGPSSHVSQAGRTPAERSQNSSAGRLARPCGRRAVAPVQGASCVSWLTVA